jgi:hypothetical protein
MSELIAHHLYDLAHPDRPPAATRALGAHGLVPCVAGARRLVEGRWVQTWVPLWSSARWFDAHGAPVYAHRQTRHARRELTGPVSVDVDGIDPFAAGDRAVFPVLVTRRWRTRYRWWDGEMLCVDGSPTRLAE